MSGFFGEWGVIAGALAASAGLAATVYAKVLRPGYRAARRLLTTFAALEDAMPTLVNLTAEFKPNDGASLRDVIDRIELTMEMQKRQVRAHLDAMACVAFFETDPDGSLVWASRGFEALTGMSPKDALGYGWSTTVHQDDRREVFEEWGRCVNDVRPFSMEFRYVGGTLVRGWAYPLIINSALVGWTASVVRLDPTASLCQLITGDLEEAEDG